MIDSSRVVLFFYYNNLQTLFTFAKAYISFMKESS